MSQRCHWYVRVGAVRPRPFLRRQLLADLGLARDRRSHRVPRAVLRATTSVGAERALTAPSALMPVTRTPHRPSGVGGREEYVFCVAPVTLTQAAPLALQRCHWYWNAVGLLLQVPFWAVRVSPTRGVP